MGNRRDDLARRHALYAELRRFCDDHVGTGGTLPSLRHLADSHGVTLHAAHAVLLRLQREGRVVSARGAGTRIVTSRFADELYVFLGDLDDPSLTGMTDRLAERGAFTIALTGLEGLSPDSGFHGAFGGLHEPGTGRRLDLPAGIATVAFGEHADSGLDDVVRWDDEAAGREATRHLLDLGHRALAFVGEVGAPGTWSRSRRDGFEAVLAEAGERPAGGSPEAVVALNDDTAMEYLAGLRERGVPLAEWPAIIGFDDVGIFGGHAIASMRPDRRAVGRAAADLLWARAHGEGGPPREVAVPMFLVPRLSSRRGWAERLARLAPGFPFG